MKPNPLRFSPIPYALLQDVELTPPDKVIAGLILRWMGSNPTGWTSNQILADDSGMHRRSVARSLSRLEKCLWFARTRDNTNGTGRRFIALWRTKAGLEALRVRLNLPGARSDVDYYAYLQSPEWQEKRARALLAAGHRCQVCNNGDVTLDCHHRTYQRLGNEHPSDLIVLCRDCHELFHESRNLAS